MARDLPSTAVGPAPLARPAEEVAEEELPDLVGKVIGGRYRVEEALSHGGMGAVFVASHIELGRRVALKVMLGRTARSREAILRFRREARTAGRSGHPNIVDVHDLGELEDGSPYLVMELLEGESLAKTLGSGGRLGVGEVVELLAPIADALDTVHAQGVVHRDIKPENLFRARRIDGSTVTKLLDFGLAAFDEPGSEERLTAQGALLGTPQYMPPEAIKGARDLGPSADIYGLACVAFELLAGAAPFAHAKSVRELIVHKITLPPPSLRERSGASASAALEEALSAGLARDPADRPATAKAFIESLRRAAAAAPEEAALGEPSPERPRRSAVIAFGLFLFGLVAACAWALRVLAAGP